MKIRLKLKQKKPRFKRLFKVIYNSNFIFCFRVRLKL